MFNRGHGRAVVSSRWSREISMVIGTLQFELVIHDVQSIKDKRRVVKSLKDKLHREHMVSVAEVGDADDSRRAVMCLALVGRDGVVVGQVLDRICAKLRALLDAEVGVCRRQVLHGAELPEEDAEGESTAMDLRDELLAHYRGEGEPQA